ncbi:phage tail tip lysozyme [Methylovirgula sp. 4M-Z18]|uniref:phage tail tip lysozyme n=1 Tax=Methylovirgula sp. 4M-Z18 TaxID=2293567 RepID=UPI000E2F4015|nr:phage tail tip lysozyme [Methylovirgula sp. 4M-Z18]RFB80019.1 hypothetical protein DYH55_00250 [Methylovirgula sp. 4M-Z18]
MAAKENIDSGAPVRQITRDVLDKIQVMSPEIKAAAEAARVSPLAVAGPMAREMNKRAVGDYGSSYLLAIQDAVREHNALFSGFVPEGTFDFIERKLSHEDYVKDMKDVANVPLAAGRFGRAWQAMQHPVLNDLGSANIRPYGAIPALEYYLGHPDRFKGHDPFGWEQYRGHYERFIADLTNKRTGDALSVRISAANALYIDDIMSRHFSNWRLLSQDQRDEFITAHSASGGTQFATLWNTAKSGAVGQAGDPQLKLDAKKIDETTGANYLSAQFDGISNLKRLRDVIYSPAELASMYLNPNSLQSLSHEPPDVPLSLPAPGSYRPAPPPFVLRSSKSPPPQPLNVSPRSSLFSSPVDASRLNFAAPFAGIDASASGSLPSLYSTVATMGNDLGWTSPLSPGFGMGNISNLRKSDVAAKVVSSLRAEGMPDSGISGLLANAMDESTLDPTLRNPDQGDKWKGTEGYYAHGLWQLGAENWNLYSDWLAQNHPGQEWRDPQMQTEALINQLKTYAPGLWKELLDPNLSKEKKAVDFLTLYENPQVKLRMQRADKYRQGVPGVQDYLDDDTPVGPSRAKRATALPATAVPSASAGRGNVVNPASVNSAFHYTIMLDAQAIARGVAPHVERAFANQMHIGSNPFLDGTTNDIAFRTGPGAVVAR